MSGAHSSIFVIGILGVLSILASAFAMRLKAPLLLVFLGFGMLAGQDGPGGIVFNDFQASYFFGSLALTEGQRRVHLAAGVHRLLFKLYNKDDRTFFSVVLSN